MAKKNTKGLFLDTRPVDQPPDTYPFGKNGIQDYKKLAIFNEPGFSISSSSIPYTINGVIETDTNPIIFSTDDVNSCIGFFNPETDTYTPIFNDTALSYKIGFKKANYITGEFQKDRTGAYIVVFTDKVLPMRYINCTTPNINKPEDLLFFLRATAPNVIVNTQPGGQLPTGSYVVYMKYAKIDGSETSYIASSAPVVVSGANGTGVSSSAIAITLTNCDTTYDYIVIGILRRIAGVTTAVELDFVNLSSTVNVVYSGDESVSTITPEELLIAPATYNTVGTVTQLNDALYIGNLGQLPAINYQQYAGLIKVQWTSQMVNMLAIPPDILSGLRKSFAHGETYDFYIRLNMIDGSRSRAFHIAGRDAISTERNSVTIGGITTKRYQVLDTVTGTNPVTRTGIPGFWENYDELYPDTIDFDSTALGGPNLRGQKVRHHRMPTHNWIANNFNTGDPNYGKNTLDILGIQVSGVVIPPNIVSLVDSYEILYAKRTIGNMTVLGQSQVYHSAQSLKLLQSGANNNFISSGGNWNSVADISTFRDMNDPKEDSIKLKFDRLRMHPFEVLFNKIELPQSGCYLQFEWKFQVPMGPNNTLSFGVDTNIPPNDRRPTDILPVVYLINTENPNVTVTPVSNGGSDYIRSYKSIQFAPNNANLGEWNNGHLETAVVGQLTANAPGVGVGDQHVAVGQVQMKKQNTNTDYVQSEDSYLATLRVIRNNVYNSFLSQTLIRTGQSFKPTVGTTTPIYAGDTFPCDYTYHNYGWTSAMDGQTGVGNQDQAGVKVIRRVLCESTANINSRYEVTGNIYSQWWPHNSVSYLSSYIMGFSRSLDPNQFGYSRDLNALNEYESIHIYNPFEIIITQFPNRIHRGGFFKREGRSTSWRTLLPLDYYEVRKDRGKIINLAGLDDNLLVHLEAALLVTQDKTTLKGDVLSVTLGTADIFQYAPQEALGTKLGYGGTQHDLACVVTPLGYVFIDNVTGQIFVFKRTLKLLNDGLNTFFKPYLKVAANNPFIGNGICLGYDPDYNRLLLTVKNKGLKSSVGGVVSGYVETPAFFNSLTPGVSIVYNTAKGAWMKFMGVNTTIYDCPSTPTPSVLNNGSFTIPEDKAIGGTVGQMTGVTGPASFLILSGNTGGAFTIDPMGLITVANGSINYATLASYSLGVRVNFDNGTHTDATATITITSVVKVPTLPSYTVAIPSGSPNTTVVNTEVGSDPNGLPLTYSIVSGNDLNAFAINSTTGVVTVIDTTKINYLTAPQFSMVIRASNGTKSVDANLTVNITPVYTAPTGSGASLNILDNTAGDTLLMTPSAPVDTDTPDGSGSVYITILTQTVEGAISVGIFQGDDDYMQFRLASTTVLDPLVTPTYTIVLRVANVHDSTKYIDLTYTINVLYNPATLSCSTYTYTCLVGGTKHWTQGRVYSSKYLRYVNTYTNSGTPIFQSGTIGAFPETIFADIPDSPDCGTVYGNVAIDGPVRRNNCSSGYTGTFVEVHIPADTYTSTTSQAAADALATAAAQAFANDPANGGTCLLDSNVSTLLIDFLSSTTADLCAYVLTPGLTESGIIVTGTIESPSGPLQLPNDGRDPATCYALSSDKLGSTSPGWRFAFNLAYFIAKYGGTLSTITFRVQGRDVSSGTVSVSYAGRDITEGHLVLGGTTGSRIPGVSAGTSVPVTVSSHIVSGANGTVGTGVGSAIIDITFALAGTLPTALTNTTY